MGASLLELLFNGLAYGIVLFLIAWGLSITMGLMGFTNLAHSSIVMFGGYRLCPGGGRFHRLWRSPVSALTRQDFRGRWGGVSRSRDCCWHAGSPMTSLREDNHEPGE